MMGVWICLFLSCVQDDGEREMGITSFVRQLGTELTEYGVRSTKIKKGIFFFLKKILTNLENGS